MIQIVFRFKRSNLLTTSSFSKTVSCYIKPSAQSIQRRSLSYLALTGMSVNIADLEADIAAQTAKFNELRLSGKPLDEVKKTLSDLKKTLALAKNAGKEKEKKVAGQAGAGG